ncbi:MAG: cupin domain-containing protein [Victivallaceae bacterium]|nr:cupin domain-containing protein [Victivallaceae bacterium]
MAGKHNKQLELQGCCKAETLSKCYEQITAWGLTMPDNDPLMLHFGLNDFFNIGEIEFWICNELKHGYCGKFIFLFAGQTCPVHFHKIKDETFYVQKGTIDISIDDSTRRLACGDVLNMPIETRHSFTAVDGAALVLEVSKPSLYRDSYFDNEKINIF